MIIAARLRPAEPRVPPGKPSRQQRLNGHSFLNVLKPSFALEIEDSKFAILNPLTFFTAFLPNPYVLGLGRYSTTLLLLNDLRIFRVLHSGF